MKRGRIAKFGTGSYFLTAVILATLLLIGINLVAVKCDRVFSVPGAHRGLSARTRAMLANVGGNIKCTVIVPRNNLVYVPLRSLLSDIREDVAGHATISMDFLDPHSDLARSADAARRYGLSGWAVVFDNGERVERIPYESLIETIGVQTDRVPPGTSGRVSFRGEQVCASTLARLAKPRSLVVYSLTGHGERDFSSYDSLTGYSDFGREISREGYVLRPLHIEAEGIPEDCDLLIVPGPRNMPVATETRAIDEYLKKGGRIMLLMDRLSSVPNGWEELMGSIGLVPSGFTAVDTVALGGYSLPVDSFGTHPITRDIGLSAVYFTNPQVIDIAATVPADISVQIIAEAPPSAWGESNPEMLPRNYDPVVDRKGSLPLVVAVEKGGENLGIRPMRAIVIGDSNFAANSMLAGGSTANRDLLLNSIAWLTDGGLASSSSPPEDGVALRLAVSRGRMIRFWLRSVFLLPFSSVLLGAVMVYLRRFTR